MRLLILGALNGHFATAGKIALARGTKVTHVETVEQALVTLRNGKGADLVFIDIALNIADLITSLQLERIVIPVIACGIGNDTHAAVQAIKAGAQEYIPLPPDPELIGAVLSAVAEEDKKLICQDMAMQRTLDMAQKIAPSEASVLITGESGTGKEVIAHYIHNHSRRKERPFISINCAAIPENLLESELFGHEKGAFTGAVARRLGKFEEANTGTLLLDEISEMHPLLQAKLLRAIQEREIDRLGGTQPIKVDIRVLATSNRNLEEEVQKGNFREDLFFRLNVVNVAIPPLRDRPGDIIPLANFFIEKYAETNGVAPLPLSADSQQKLLTHGWRGNVRELENTMHRAILLATGSHIDTEAIILSGESQATTMAHSSNSAAASLPQNTGFRTNAGAVGSPPLPPVAPTMPATAEGDMVPEAHASDPATRHLVGRTVADVERELIIDTLSHCYGNRTHAATILGISIRTLRNKLRQYRDEGVDVPQPGATE